MGDELKSCPFCDGPGALIHSEYELCDGWHVVCHGKKDCPLFCSDPYRPFDTEAEAIQAWNTRTETQSQATIDELVGLAADFMDGCTNDECELCARGRALLSARKGEGNG